MSNIKLHKIAERWVDGDDDDYDMVATHSTLKYIDRFRILLGKRKQVIVNFCVICPRLRLLATEYIGYVNNFWFNRIRKL